jgi:pimeloyl-ACP methyl ester carboxylesterase
MTLRQKCTRASVTIVLACLAASVIRVSAADDRDTVVTIDRYVPVQSSVPTMAGQTAALYVRERARLSTIANGMPLGDHVVLFIHGAGTPAEVAFDVPYAGYSWMAFLAEAGYDVFAADMTGYGRSTRPLVMNDPCNLTAAQQGTFVPALLASPCPPSHNRRATTIASDWDDVGAVVEYVRALRHVAKVTLIGWSLGGTRSMGYASRHPEAVSKLIELAPAYARNGSSDPPAVNPAEGAPFNSQSHAEFTANWDRQVGCANQYDPAVSEAVWSAMLASDPVGATWGTGVRRAPNTTSWGWNQAAAARITVPTLLVSGVHDKQVSPAGVRTLLADLGSTNKVFVDLACSSHNAMWEVNHTRLFRASLEFLASGTVEGRSDGVVPLGY